MRLQWTGRFLAWASVLTVALVVALPRAAAQVLYAVDGGGSAMQSSLYTVNGTTLSAIGVVKLSNTPVPISALAFDPTSGVLYGTTNASASTQLVQIDLATATATSEGTIGFSMQGLGFTSGGVLYGYSKAGITGNSSFPKESLYTITKSSGAAQLVGPSGFSNTMGDGMAVNSLGAIFFAGNQSNGQLSNLSPSNGQQSTFANLTGGPATAAPIKGLSFDNSGNLFGIYNGGTTDLLQIGTAPSGGNVTVTDLGSFSPTPPSVLTALAFQPVPEPGAFALVGSAALTFLWVRRGRHSHPADLLSN
jgi:hypothetical protein